MNHRKKQKIDYQERCQNIPKKYVNGVWYVRDYSDNAANKREVFQVQRIVLQELLVQVVLLWNPKKLRREEKVIIVGNVEVLRQVSQGALEHCVCATLGQTPIKLQSAKFSLSRSFVIRLVSSCLRLIRGVIPASDQGVQVW